MQRIFILVFLLAVGLGVYFLVTSDSDTEDPTITDVDQPAKGSKKDGELKGSPGNTGPNALPALKALKKSSRVLFIGHHQGTWPMTMIMTIQAVRDLEYRTWFMDDIETRKGAAGDGRGMEALNDTPTGQYLIDHDVEALLLDMVDPNSFPESFWNVVTDRVQRGRMGLFFRPSYMSGDGGQGLSQHPALAHPMFKALLPIERAALIQGTPAPGLFNKEQPLRVTALGLRHPATVLVKNEEAAGKAWARTAAGQGSFGTKFCYPVLELKSGAQSLVELEATTPIPAIVATAPGEGKPRVLWMGNTDFGQKTHGVRSKDEIQKLLVNHWVFWLIGQAE